MKTDVIYKVLHPGHVVLYSVSPDGLGAYWYDTIEQARDDFPDLPVQVITSVRLDEIRSVAEVG